MILTCPECATSYFVDDSRIPAAGRSVKCSSCGARWVATLDGVAEAPTLNAAPAPQAASEPAVEPPPAAVAAEPAAPPIDDLEFVPSSAAEPEKPPGRARHRRSATGKSAPSARREAKATAFVWAVAAVVVVALVGAAILFRAEVVRVWPKSSAAYAGLGLPVESVGLVIESVRVEPTFEGGRPVLSLTGAVRNVRDEAVKAPALRISLLDRTGKAIAAKVARPLDPLIPAGALRHFALAISDPPSNAQNLRVTFDTAAPQRAAGVTPIPAPAPAGPAPIDAQPLPPGSPDALSEHG